MYIQEPCLASTDFTDFVCFVLPKKISAFECAMAGLDGHEIRELINPLISASQPAGAFQQVMSPTQGYGTTAIPSPPPGRDGILSGSTPPRENAHSGAGGFEPMAAGRAFEGAGQRESLQDSGEAPQVPTTRDGGIGAHHSVPAPGITPGESSGLQVNTGRSGTGTEHGRRDGEAVPGEVAAEHTHEGFVTPRSQQGLPTIAEMVEGFPASGLQLMTRVGDFFRVARTEVVQVPAVRQGTYATPPRTATSQTRDSPSGASGPMALGDEQLATTDGSTWHPNILCTASRKGWPFVERRHVAAHAGFRTEGSPPVR